MEKDSLNAIMQWGMGFFACWRLSGVFVVCFVVVCVILVSLEIVWYLLYSFAENPHLCGQEG